MTAQVPTPEQPIARKRFIRPNLIRSYDFDIEDRVHFPAQSEVDKGVIFAPCELCGVDVQLNFADETALCGDCFAAYVALD